MRTSDFVLVIFAVLVVFSLVAKGLHSVITGNAPDYLKISGK